MKPDTDRILYPDSPPLSRTAQGSAAPLSPDCHRFSRLVTMREAAEYLRLSYWTVRDYVANGTLPTVRLPATRIDTQPRRNGKPTQRHVVPAGDARLGTVRRVLIDVRDLDALIDSSKGRELP